LTDFVTICTDITTMKFSSLASTTLFLFQFWINDLFLISLTSCSLYVVILLLCMPLAALGNSLCTCAHWFISVLSSNEASRTFVFLLSNIDTALHVTGLKYLGRGMRATWTVRIPLPFFLLSVMWGVLQFWRYVSIVTSDEYHHGLEARQRIDTKKHQYRVLYGGWGWRWFMSVGKEWGTGVFSALGRVFGEL
jgi:hypothetical protein